MKASKICALGSAMLALSISTLLNTHAVFAERVRYPVQPVLIPTPILHGKKVFLNPPASPTLTFQDFQQDLQGWTYFTFVQSPQDADLLWEYREDPVSLTITDPSTKVVLWTVNIPSYGYTPNAKKMATQNAQGLMLELKQLVGTSVR